MHLPMLQLFRLNRFGTVSPLAQLNQTFRFKNYETIKGFHPFLRSEGIRSYSQILKQPLPQMEATKFASTEGNTKRLGRSREKIEVDGMFINWESAGIGDHVVLLLPGVMGCIEHDFVPIFQNMDKSKYTLVSWDPPGYGLSRPPDKDFSGDHFLRDVNTVVKLMDKLGYHHFSILGWSYGGITGARIAASFPSRILSLVTWGSFAFNDKPAQMFMKYITDTKNWSPKRLQPVLAMYGQEYLQSMLKNLSDEYFREDPEGMDQIFRDALLKIHCPTLVIHGEKDPAVGINHAEYLRNHIKNSRMWVMPNGRHNMHLQYTNQFIETVSEFLDSSTGKNV